MYDFSGSPLKIKAPEGAYWIVVHQRNHLSVMSSSQVTLTQVTPPLIVPRIEFDMDPSQTQERVLIEKNNITR